MLKTARCFLSLLSLLFLFAAFSSPTSAEEYFFQEEFNVERSDNTLDTNKWIIYPNQSGTGINPTIKETAGVLRLFQTFNRSQFPLVVSKNQVLPAGDYSAEIKFRYTNITHWGTGFALSDIQPTNSTSYNSLFSVSIWQDLSVGPSMRIGFDGVDVKTFPINTDSHTLKIEHIGKRYLLYFDNLLVFTSPETTENAKYIWFGHPTTLNYLVPQWTTLSIDYVRVNSTAPQPFLDLPWDYESKGLSFNEAALNINSYFDHEYPLLSIGLVEPPDATNNLTNYEGKFKSRLDYSSHDGYDYGRKAKANYKDPQLAAAPGWATYMNSCGACGNAILIDHENGFQTRYYHLDSEGLISNTPGQKVKVEAKQPIGKIGFTGNVSPSGEGGAHIHFMVVQDKNKDGNFNDNIPDGLIDPFGWQSSDPDPWENYTFSYNGINRTGAKSYYLWKKQLDNLNASLTSNGGVFNTERFEVKFPSGSTNENLNLDVKSSPLVKISNLLESLGSTLTITAKTLGGNPFTNFLLPFELKIDFSKIDLARFKTDTISIYSSPDGENWTKEPTQVDLNSKTAVSQINHLTHFALIAERLDTTPPITTALLEGQQGETNFFRSDVKLSLSASDTNGLGVDLTLIKLPNEGWKEYTAPLTFTSEGTYNIEFYSIDKDENIEEVKSVEFTIDKSTPELEAYFDPSQKKIKVVGINNQTTLEPTETKLNALKLQYTIKDKSGNSIQLTSTRTDTPNGSTLTFNSLTYNNQPAIAFNNTRLQTTFNFTKNAYKNLIQIYQENNKTLLKLELDSKKNNTNIFQIEGTKLKPKETKLGMAILKLSSEKGTLKISY